MNENGPQKREHIPELRSYAFHQRAAEILLAQPERLAEVYKTLHRWLAMEDKQLKSWALKWLELVDQLDAEDVAELIVMKGQTMDLLRKSSPFAGILSEEVRMEILKKHKYD